MMKTLLEILGPDDPARNFHTWIDHTTKFKPSDRSFGGKNGQNYKLKVERAGRGSLYYNVHHPKDGQVGSFYVRTNGLNHISVMNANTDEKHQRNGIASHVYRTVMADSTHTGMTLKPQDFDGPETSPDAKKLWSHLQPEKYKT